MLTRTGSSKQWCIVVVLACVVCREARLASAQYGYMRQHKANQQHQYDMQQGYAMEEEEQEEERPRINFGIRLRVPAMKLELPRFNLPKITVTAKIRQPDGPRVIKLPAINLDTSSRLEPPGGVESSSKQQLQQSDDHGGFDDDSYQSHYNQYPNSPASRARHYQQQHQQQASYHQAGSATSYAGPASTYHRESVYRAPQVYRNVGHRFY